MKIYMRKHLDALRPSDDFQRDIFDKITDGASVQVEVKQPRNIDHHRLFFAMLNLAFNNQEHYETLDQFRAALAVHIGHCDFTKNKDGVLVAIPKSISFAKMDQAEFSMFFDSCVDAICKSMLNGTESDSFRNELMDMVR